jgi:hypothetical protein
VAALPATFAPALLLAAALGSGLACAAGRIARWRQVRVARILAQFLGELGDLLGQRRHRRHQRRQLRVLGNQGGLELGDPLRRVQQST